jgi:hypothetical protein
MVMGAIQELMSSDQEWDETSDNEEPEVASLTISSINFVLDGI